MKRTLGVLAVVAALAAGCGNDDANNDEAAVTAEPAATSTTVDEAAPEPTATPAPTVEPTVEPTPAPRTPAEVIAAFELPETLNGWAKGDLASDPTDPNNEPAVQFRALLAETPGCENYLAVVKAPELWQAYVNPEDPERDNVTISASAIAPTTLHHSQGVEENDRWTECIELGFTELLGSPVLLTPGAVEVVEVGGTEFTRTEWLVDYTAFAATALTGSYTALIDDVLVEVQLSNLESPNYPWEQAAIDAVLTDVSATFDQARGATT